MFTQNIKVKIKNELSRYSKGFGVILGTFFSTALSLISLELSNLIPSKFSNLNCHGDLICKAVQSSISPVLVAACVVGFALTYVLNGYNNLILKTMTNTCLGVLTTFSFGTSLYSLKYIGAKTNWYNLTLHSLSAFLVFSFIILIINRNPNFTFANKKMRLAVLFVLIVLFSLIVYF